MSAILVVEQDPGYANRIVAALRAAGHEVVIAGHRDEAETATRSRHPDLVLANGMMPGAKELLGRFSSSQGGPGSVVLLPVTLASHTTPDAYSADGVLSKPFSDEDLERVVSGCLTPAAPQAAPPQPAPPRSVPQPPTPQPAAPQPAAPQPAAPKPAAAPQPAPPQQAAPKPPKATVDDDIDDLLNRTLSGLDIASLTKKRPKPRPAAPEPAAPEPAAPEPAAPQPATAQPAAPPPATPPAAASRSSLTSTDIFGDVLAEVQAESEKTRSRQSTPPQVAAPPPGPAAPQPEAPQPPAPQPAAPRPAAPKPPTQRRPNFDDDLDRKLEETLSGVLPSRLRRKPAEPAPGPAAPGPAAPQPAAPQPATTPPSANFGAPMPEPASSPPPAPVEPDLPPDFSEDETVSIVRPVTLQRDESTPAPAPQAEEADPPDTSGAEPAQDTVPEPDAFATTLLPTRSDGSSQVQPPADFTPMSEQPPASEPAPPQPAALEPPAPQPAAPQPAASEPAASEPPAPQPAAGMPSFGDLGDGSDEFEISFGEEPPEAPEDENIWAAYGSGETAGWSTTSFEAQSPVTETPAMESSAAPASESVAPPPATPQPAAPEPAAPQPAAPEPAALDLDADETAAPDPSLDATDRGADSGWDPDTGWGTVEGAATDEEAVPVPPAAAPSGPSDFDADASVWDVPSVDEEPASSQARPSEEPPIWEPQEPIGDPDFSSLQEDPVLEFDEDFLPPPLQPSEPEPSAPEPAAPEPAAPEPAAPEPAAPEPAAPELSAPEPAAPEPAEPAAPEPAVPEPTAPLLAPGNAFGDLSHELGAEDSGFHTALQGVLQIRGGDEEATAAGDQGLPFGDYRLLERVAVGGMAEVWRARRRGVEGFQKTVAIKRILSHLTGSTDFITMFIDEAKLAAQLNHANIAQIYDLGKVDEDFYIAMEFVDGRDLRTLLREANQKRKPLPLGLAMMIIAAVARGLDYAHRKRDFENRELGLVHRDVSPQNVLVSTEGEIKLCDFGIVKAVAKASTTQMGALKGKLQYMSPEQAWGKDVDGRSDIFSLGSVMFEALTGEKLFTGDSEIGVLDAVRDCRIKSARSIDPTIPESVERILEKTLKPTPGERYQTAGEMEKDIQAVLETLKPTPGQSELSTYMHSLVEAEPAATERQAADARSGTGATGAAGEQDPSAAWTGTSWGTASFAADEQADVVSSKPPEPVTSRPAATASSAVPASSKVPVSSKVAASSKMPPPKASKKGGGKLIWILLVLTMLAIVAVVAWTRLRDSGPSSEAAPEAPEATTPLPTEGAEASAGAAGEGAAAEGEEVDQKQLLEQIMQEELDRKKKEMEEQFEAQKEELERRLKEVEGDG